MKSFIAAALLAYATAEKCTLVNRKSGLVASYYDLEASDFGPNNTMPDYRSMTPYKTEVVMDMDYTWIDNNYDFGGTERRDHFGIVLEGYVNFHNTGKFTFGSFSDDGSKLFIND